uniref:Uncharacterized protein n=1 Tax=Nelumbo nucifera TaxID=4432 RepID=A0A822Z7K1_NELNU|nr:TPA_asm: hypothetical protein HUJ06_013984 [Nelumbo nucifera]
MGGFQGKTWEGNRGKGVSVTKYNPSWSDQRGFSFLLTVKLE